MRKDEDHIIDKFLLLYLIDQIFQKGFRISGALKLQKIIFLAEWEMIKRELKGFHFKFFRYNLGPYSKQLQLDYNSLAEKGFINKSTYSLTVCGRSLIKHLLSVPKIYEENAIFFQSLDESLNKWGIHSGEELKNKIYNMSITPHDLPNFETLIKDIPMFFDIIVPELLQNLKEFKLPPDAIEDLEYEFSLTTKDRKLMRIISNTDYEERFDKIHIL